MDLLRGELGLFFLPLEWIRDLGGLWRDWGDVSAPDFNKRNI
jgi:hypothetical protein